MGGGNTSCIFYTLYTLYILIHFLHFTHSIQHSQKRRGKAQRPKREKGKLGAHKGTRENRGNLFCDRIPRGNQTARTPARTWRHEIISRLDSPPTSDLGKTQEFDLHEGVSINNLLSSPKLTPNEPGTCRFGLDVLDW